MGLMVKDLRPAARPIAQNLIDRGFSMVDIASIGILFLDGKDAIDISELRKEINSQMNLSPREIVERSTAHAIAHKRKWNPKNVKTG